MKTALKIILIIGLSLTLLVSVALGLVIYKPKLVEGQLQNIVYSQTGLRFTTDNISLKLSPTIISIDGFLLINPEWNDSLPLLESNHIKIQLDLAEINNPNMPFWSASIHDTEARIALDDAGKSNWMTSTLEQKETSDDALPLKQYLRFNNISILNSKLHQIQASDHRILNIEKFELVNSENQIALDGAGLFENEPISIKGNIDAKNLDEGARELILSLQGNGLGVDIESSGTLNLNNFRDTTFKADIKTNNLDKLEKLFATEFPKLVPIDLSITLLSPENENLKFTAEGNIKNQPISLNGTLATNKKTDKTPISLEITGLASIIKLNGVIDIEKLENLDLIVEANIEDLASYEELLGQELPNISAIKTRFNLNKDKSLLNVSEIDFTANNASLKGSLSYDTKKLRLLADLQSDTLDLSPYFENNNPTTIESEHNETDDLDDPPEISVLVDNNANRFSSDIKFSSNLLTIKEHGFEDLNVELNLSDGLLQITNFVSKYKRVDKDDVKYEFTTTPISLAGSVKLPSKDHNTTNIDITLDDQDMKLAVKGSLVLADAITGKLAIEGTAKKLSTLSEYLQQDLKVFTPVTLNIVANFNDQAVDLNPFMVEIEGNDLTGQTVIDWSQDKVSINGNFQSNNLDLNHFGLGNQSNEDSNDEVRHSEKVFSDMAINWDWLDEYNVDVGINLTQLAINKTKFRSVTARAQLANGKLLIDPFDGILSNGGVRGTLSLEKYRQGVKIKTDFVGLNITPADLGESDKGVIDGGNTDVEINLSMAGSSAHDLASSLNGEVVLEMRKAKVRNDLLERLGSDIFLKTLSMLNPFIKEDEYTNLDCAAVRFVAKDGELVSKNQIAIETSKVEIVAGGIVNLQTEQLEIGFTPVAKKGLGVNIGNLVKVVRLGGTLRNPTPEADPAGMLKSGAAIGAAISTGGLSLLVDGLFKRLTTAGTACNHIFEEEAEVPNSLESR